VEFIFGSFAQSMCGSPDNDSENQVSFRSVVLPSLRASVILAESSWGRETIEKTHPLEKPLLGSHRPHDSLLSIGEKYSGDHSTPAAVTGRSMASLGQR
jgi:hypothetical protein